jgi:hypothetical protein
MLQFSIDRRNWTLWPTRESVQEGVLSALAIVECVCSSILIWYLSFSLESYLVLLLPVIVCPLAMLRTKLSEELSVLWFYQWYLSRRNIEASDQIVAVLVGLLMGFLCYSLFFFDLIGNFDSINWRIMICIFAASWMGGMVVGRMGTFWSSAIGSGLSILCLIALADYIVYWVDEHNLLTGIVEIGELTFIIFALISGVSAILAASAVFLIFVMLIRSAARLRYPPSLADIVQNYKRYVCCALVFHPRELLHGISEGHTRDLIRDTTFNLANYADKIGDAEQSVDSHRNHAEELKTLLTAIGFFGFYGFLIAIPFVSTVLLRLVAKSTFWLLWPLAFWRTMQHQE